MAFSIHKFIYILFPYCIPLTRETGWWAPGGQPRSAYHIGPLVLFLSVYFTGCVMNKQRVANDY